MKPQLLHFVQQIDSHTSEDKQYIDERIRCITLSTDLQRYNELLQATEDFEHKILHWYVYSTAFSECIR